VLDEEIDYIVGWASRSATARRSRACGLLEQGYDAVFVGSGAPKGKELDLPGRWDAPDQRPHRHRLAGVGRTSATSSDRPRVLVIGVGNTAMDCCRSAAAGRHGRQGDGAPPRPFFKASPWELEDAEEERVEIVENHAPKRFVVEDGRLVGMEFERLEWYEENGRQRSRVLETVVFPCDEVILAIGQENAFPWIERDVGIEFDEWDMPVVDRVTFQSTREGVFFGGDAAWGPENIIWAVEHGHQAAISIHQPLRGAAAHRAPALRDEPAQRQAGDARLELPQRLQPLAAHADAARGAGGALPRDERRGRARVHPEQTAREVQRCLNCDVQTHFTAELCIECDACVDVCPVSCLTIAPDGPEEEVRLRLSAPAANPEQALYASLPLPHTGRLMLKDEDICVHCGLCAERCPTAAWDMQKFELLIPYAGQGREEGRGKREESGGAGSGAGVFFPLPGVSA
jgi:formate dehydrogenase (NADP+) beta subunit